MAEKTIEDLQKENNSLVEENLKLQEEVEKQGNTIQELIDTNKEFAEKVTEEKEEIEKTMNDLEKEIEALKATPGDTPKELKTYEDVKAAYDMACEVKKTLSVQLSNLKQEV